MTLPGRCLHGVRSILPTAAGGTASNRQTYVCMSYVAYWCKPQVALQVGLVLPPVSNQSGCVSGTDRACGVCFQLDRSLLNEKSDGQSWTIWNLMIHVSPSVESSSLPPELKPREICHWGRHGSTLLTSGATVVSSTRRGR